MAIAAFLALPLAAALPAGVDATGIRDAQASGVTPKLGQIWVGPWMKSSGWGAFENGMRDMRDKGVTPVVLWYYWGDSISVDAVKYGRDGRTKWEWDAMARDMAGRINSIMGGRETLVVLEPEFNKQGISQWETFDGYLADQSYAIQAIAPGVKTVVGFGHWGGWEIFDRAMAASDYSGFQMMRGSTRDSVASAEGAADQSLSITKTLKARFGKGVYLYDLAIASYGGWEGVQERSIQRFVAKAGELEAAGLRGIVWRYMRDNSYSSGYYGPAESSWGVITTWGAKKPAHDDVIALLRGGQAAATSTTTYTAASAPAPSGNPFTNVKGNEWWIQADVSGGPTAVHARVNGGTWVALSKQSWGSWAVSTRAPTGSVVELRATYAGGATRSASYAWPSATPTGGATTTGTFDATFTNVKGNDWWIQASVGANQPLAKVNVRVNGGAWTPLAKQSWGAWAVSTRIPYGSWVELQAVSSTGATEMRPGVAWRG